MIEGLVMIKEGLFQSKQGLETLKEWGHALSCQGGAVKIPLNYCRARPLQVKSLFAQFFPWDSKHFGIKKA